MRSLFWLALYLSAAAGCWAASAAPSVRNSPGRKIWRCISLAMLALGIVRSLHLYEAITVLGRQIFVALGLYGNRYVLWPLLATLALGAVLVVALFMLRWMKNASFAAHMALFGLMMALGVTAIRAASNHNVDAALGAAFIGVPLGWALEAGAILLTLFAGLKQRFGYSPTAAGSASAN